MLSLRLHFKKISVYICLLRLCLKKSVISCTVCIGGKVLKLPSSYFYLKIFSAFASKLEKTYPFMQLGSTPKEKSYYLNIFEEISKLFDLYFFKYFWWSFLHSSEHKSNYFMKSKEWYQSNNNNMHTWFILSSSVVLVFENSFVNSV